MANKVLICMSGGLDSSVTTALYRVLGYEVHLLLFDYNHPSFNLEENAVRKIMDKLEIPEDRLREVKLSIPWALGNKTNDNMYIEMRNLIFLANAISIAESQGIGEVAIGFINTPIDYNDTSELFLSQMNEMSLTSTGIAVKAPLKNLNKAQVLALGVSLGLNTLDVVTCMYPLDGKACGKCVCCKDLLDASTEYAMFKTLGGEPIWNIPTK